jgi:hypothetical protein
MCLHHRFFLGPYECLWTCTTIGAQASFLLVVSSWYEQLPYAFRFIRLPRPSTLALSQTRSRFLSNLSLPLEFHLMEHWQTKISSSFLFMHQILHHYNTIFYSPLSISLTPNLTLVLFSLSPFLSCFFSLPAEPATFYYGRDSFVFSYKIKNKVR